MFAVAHWFVFVRVAYFEAELVSVWDYFEIVEQNFLVLEPLIE